MAHDIRLIDVKAHGFAAGLVNLTCPCGWRDTVARMLALPRQQAHAAACAACQVDDPDAPAVLALQMATDDTSGHCRKILRALRSCGYDITPIPKETP